MQVHVEMGSVLEVYKQKVQTADRATSLSTALSEVAPPPLQAPRHYGAAHNSGTEAATQGDLLHLDAPEATLPPAHPGTLSSPTCVSWGLYAGPLSAAARAHARARPH